MKIKVCAAVLMFLGFCSAVATHDKTAFAGTVSFEGGGLPTPCPPPPILQAKGVAGLTCVNLQIQK